MRTATMGLDRATRKEVRPSRREQARMERMLTEALDAGFVGMSAQQLLFDKLDGDLCRSRTLPSTYAKGKEMRGLRKILRRRRRALQAGPDASHPHTIGVQALGSIGWFGKPALRTSLLSAADIKAIPFVIHLMRPIASIVNKLGADFRWQHLPVPFEVYADGIDLVIFEEFGSGAMALHIQEKLARDELMRDPEYRKKFRKDYESKYGPRVWHRDFFDAEIVACPDASVVGKSFGQVGVERGGKHPVDAFLDLVLEHGTDIRWRTTISNHRPDVLKKLAADPGIQVGFSDAGAHLRNMAFYNFGLRLLKHVRDAEVRGQAVHDDRAGRAPAHRRARRVVPDRRRHPARGRPRRPRRARPRAPRREPRGVRREPGRAVRRPVPDGQPQRRRRTGRLRRGPAGGRGRRAHRRRSAASAPGSSSAPSAVEVPRSTRAATSLETTAAAAS